MLSALVWDVDGTLAETERDGHRVAFNAAFADAGLPWTWDVPRYGELLQVTGGLERLLHDMSTQPDAPTGAEGREALARQLHRAKNVHYERLMAEGGIALRPGVREMFDDAEAAGVTMAIATTSSRGNVAAMLHAQLGESWRDRFVAVLGAEDAATKKPDPLVYLLALKALGVPGDEVIALEDSPAGAEAALAAGLSVVVTRSLYFADDVADGPSGRVLAVGPGLGDVRGWQPGASAGEGAARVDLGQLRRWHDAPAR